jgi:hypothetical protein
MKKVMERYHEIANQFLDQAKQSIVVQTATNRPKVTFYVFAFTILTVWLLITTFQSLRKALRKPASDVPTTPNIEKAAGARGWGSFKAPQRAPGGLCHLRKADRNTLIR